MRTYTLDTLPADGYLYVHATGERHTPESSEFGDAAERGWVDANWSRATLFESRNDAAPLVAVPVTDIRDAVDVDVLGTIRDFLGYVDNSDDGTLYGADAVTHDYTSADTFTYAVHVTVKHLVNGVHREDPVHIPAEDVNNH